MNRRSTTTQPARPGLGTGHGPSGPLIGREVELERLLDALDHDRWMAVVGEAGVGKTTLVRAAAAAAGRRTHLFGGLATLAERPLAAVRGLLGPIDGDAAYVASALERLVGPDVLIVDDLQWLDPASRAAVGLLADRVAILGAVRTGTESTGAALAFADGAGFERLALGPLRPEAGAALARSMDPTLSDAQATRIARRAGGNAFFTVELATAGSTTATIDVVIRQRLADIGGAGLASAGRLAVLGRPALPAEIGPGTAELIRAGIATDDGATVAFQHQLLAEHLLASLDDAALAKARSEAAAASSDHLEAARLYLAAGRPGDAAEAAELAERTATTTGERIEALVVRATTAEGPEAARLKVAAAGELIGVHDYAGAAGLLDGVTAWDPASAVRIASLRGRIDGIVGNVEGLKQRFGHVIDDARALVADGDPDGPALLVEALRNGAQVLGWTGDPEGGLGLAEEAVDIATRAGIAPAAAQTLLGYLLLTAERPFEAIGPLREAVASRAIDGDGPNELQAMNVLLLAEMSISGTAAALRTCRRLIDRAGELHLYANREAYKAYLVFLLDAAGEYHEALAVAEEMAGALGARSAIYGPAYTALALTRVGRFEAARAMLARLDERRPEDPEAERVYLDIAGTIDLAEGRAGPAERAYELFAALPQKSEADRQEPRLNAMWARWDLGRPPGPPIDPGPTPRVAGVGPESRGLALLGEGAYVAAAEQFGEGTLAWDPFHAWNADRCRWAAGEALRLGGKEALAIERLLASEAVAIARDARPQLVRIQRSLRLLGMRRTAPRAAIGADLLSGREQELLDLVAGGQTNAEIARRLGLGRPTIARMLSSAMAKLGVDHRAQLAAREPV